MSLQTMLEDAIDAPRRAAINLGQLQFSCRLQSDDLRALAWTRWFLRPWFEATTTEPAWNIAFLRDDDLFDALQQSANAAPQLPIHPCVQHSHSPRPSFEFSAAGLRTLLDGEFATFCVAFPEKKSLLFISQTENPRAVNSLMRVVREFATLDHQRRGAVILHAAALEIDGLATLALAPKHGGKTTFLIGALERGARMVGNDRLVLLLHRDSIEAVGIPTIIALRDGTLDLFPELKEKMRRNWMHFRRQAQSLQQSTRRNISPLQLCQLMDAHTCVRAKVDRLLFLTEGKGAPQPLNNKKLGELFRASLFDFTDTDNHFFADLYSLDKQHFAAAVDRFCEALPRLTRMLHFPRENHH